MDAEHMLYLEQNLQPETPYYDINRKMRPEVDKLFSVPDAVCNPNCKK